MSTKFERSAAQIWIETKVGCNDLEAWNKFAKDLSLYEISTADLPLLKSALESDSGSYLIKGMLTLIEAIRSIERGNYSWAVVKLYYSVFYLNRASLGAKNYALIRNKNWFLLKLSVNEKPEIKKGDKYKNDHDAVISTYIDLYGGSDFLQSNDVEGLNSYKWLSARRNQINYQQIKFADPEVPSFMEDWKNLLKTTAIKDILKSYLPKENPNIFQPEHAWIAIPFLRAQNAIQDFLNTKISIPISSLQLDLLMNQMEGSLYFETESIDKVFRIA